jgi:hypothetical protein
VGAKGEQIGAKHGRTGAKDGRRNSWERGKLILLGTSLRRDKKLEKRVEKLRALRG